MMLSWNHRYSDSTYKPRRFGIKRKRQFYLEERRHSESSNFGFKTYSFRISYVILNKALNFSEHWASISASEKWRTGIKLYTFWRLNIKVKEYKAYTYTKNIKHVNVEECSGECSFHRLVCWSADKDWW